MGMLARMYHQYSKSIILFLIMHPTFYFSIFFAMISEYNSYAIILVIIKTLDIAVKILLIDKIFIKKEFSEDLALALFAKINIFLPYIGLVIYPALILLAL
ncbi:MAG: hypothetical protein COB17_08945 [Sulfurimonas sp.]|nr:MAG: hypothetical protein COB17_08945 [Sulfurimonas sp.]